MQFLNGKKCVCVFYATVVTTSKYGILPWYIFAKVVLNTMQNYV